MPTYLSFDGVDDVLQTPSFSWDEVILDFSYAPTGNFQKLLGLSNAGYIQVASRPVDSYSADFSAVYVNGVLATNSTDFIPNDTRATLRALKSATTAVAAFFFRTFSTSGYLRGNLYSARFLLGGVTQAYYDMSTGTVLDQSGNARNGTLTGGTWVSDAPASVDVSYQYAMKQSITALGSSSASMTQQISSSRIGAAATRQAIIANRTASVFMQQEVTVLRAVHFSTRQVVMANRQDIFATQQSVVSGFIWHSGNAPMRVVITAERQVRALTKQVISGQRASPFSTRQQVSRDVAKASLLLQSIKRELSIACSLQQVISAARVFAYPVSLTVIDPDQRVIGTIRLIGHRELAISLQGRRELIIKLQGRVE